jgi:hypothetical protein
VAFQPAKGHENRSETQAGKPAPRILPGETLYFARPSDLLFKNQFFVDFTAGGI